MKGSSASQGRYSVKFLGFSGLSAPFDIIFNWEPQQSGPYLDNPQQKGLAVSSPTHLSSCQMYTFKKTDKMQYEFLNNLYLSVFSLLCLLTSHTRLHTGLYAFNFIIYFFDLICLLPFTYLSSPNLPFYIQYLSFVSFHHTFQRHLKS